VTLKGDFLRGLGRGVPVTSSGQGDCANCGCADADHESEGKLGILQRFGGRWKGTSRRIPGKFYRCLNSGHCDNYVPPMNESEIGVVP